MLEILAQAIKSTQDQGRMMAGMPGAARALVIVSMDCVA